MRKLVLSVVVGLTLATAGARAQDVPGEVAFTARLVDNGTPVNGTRTIDLKLFDAETGGTEIWTETHNGVSVTDGLAYVAMGSSSTLDAFTLDGSPRWLQISVNGTIMMPRLSVESVPYAIRAGTASNAETLGGLPPGDFVTGVTAGIGLAGGGSTGDVNLTADTAYLQRRVGSCTAGQTIQSIAADGTPTCLPVGTGDITGVSIMSGGGLVGGATAGDAPLALVSCSPGEILKFSAVGWVCALDDNAGGDITAINIGAGGGLTGATSSGDATLALVSCASGDTLIYGASGWGCGTAGDISGITTAAGSGLTGGVASGAATLALAACLPGQVLQYSGGASGWQCAYPAAINPSTVAYDSGWLAAPFRTQVLITHGVTSADAFPFILARGRDETGAEIVAPIMSAEQPSYGVGYNELSSTTLGFQPWDYLFGINNLGDRNNMLIIDGEIRVRMIDPPPTSTMWDSGWQACSANNTYTFLHTLGVMPQYVHLEVAQNSDGTGWRVPQMSSNNYDSANWRQTSIVGLTATTVTYRTQTSLAYFYRNGATVAPSSGYCRARLYNWTPNYDSGWVSISTAVGNRDKVFQHNLGQVPSLVSVYVAQNSDGSGWLVSGLNAYHYTYNYGTSVYRLDENFAVIKGGAAITAHFVDSAGVGTGATSGYVRFMAWR